MEDAQVRRGRWALVLPVVWPGVPHQLLHTAHSRLGFKYHGPSSTRDKQKLEHRLRYLRNGRCCRFLFFWLIVERCACSFVIGVCLVNLAVIARGSTRSRIIDAGERRPRAGWLRSNLNRDGPGERWKGHLVVREVIRGREVVVHG